MMIQPDDVYQYELPQAGHSRWIPRHKQQVVQAVCYGLISLPEACGRYTLSLDEFLSWWRRYGRAKKRSVKKNLP